MKTTKTTTVSLRTNRKNRKSALRRSILAASIGALFAVVSAPNAAHATTWNGAAAGNNNWSAGGAVGNWLTGTVGVNDNLLFDNGAALKVTNNNDFVGLVVNTITFNAGATNGAYTLSGNAITLNGGITNNTVGVTQTIGFGGTGITLGAPQTWTAAAGALNVTSAVNAGGVLFTIDGAQNTTLGGIVSGANILTKNGAGNLTLSAANTFSGSYGVNAGTLTLNGSNANLVQVLLTNASSLVIGAAGSVTTSNALGVRVQGTSTISAAAATSTITGNVNYTSTASSAFIGVIAGAASTVTMNNGSTTTAGASLELNGNNNYGGLTTVTSGRLFIGNNNGLGGTGAGTTVASGATLAINGGINIGAEALSIAGTGITSGGVGVGALQFGTFGAGTSGYAGLITLTANATIGSSFAVTANISGGIDTAGNTLTLGTNAFAGNPAIYNISAPITGAGGIVVSSQSTTNLTASNTYTGSTSIINGGILNASAAGALPAPAADGGTGTVRSALIMDQSGTGSSRLNLVGFNQAVASLTGAATSTINLNAQTLTVGTAAGSTTFNGVISGAGSLIKDGNSTLILGGLNTFGGSTTVQGGILSLTVANALPVGTVLNVGVAAGSAPGLQVNLNGNNQSISALNFIAGNGFESINLGGATLFLTGNVSVTSNTTAPGAGASSNINFFGGGGALDLAAGVRTFNIAGQSKFVLNGDLQIGAIIQNGGITLNQTAASANGDPAVLQLGGVNTYAGVTTINSGVLRASNDSALGSTAGGTVVANGATLQLGGGSGGGTGFSLTVNIGAEALTLNGVGAAGAGGVGNLGALATGGGINSYAGAITAASNATISANGGTLTLSGGINKNGVDLTLGGLTSANAGGKIIINTVGISGAAANSDLIVDSVTVDEDVANSYNGKTFIRSTVVAGSGILNTGVAFALPTSAVVPRTTVIMDETAAFVATGLGSSVLNLGGTVANPAGANQAIASLDGLASSRVTLGNNTLTIGFGTGVNTNGNAAAKFAGVISGTGPGFAIIKDDTSTQILTGVNTYIGFTAVNGGTLRVGDGVTAGSQLGTGLVFVNPTGTLDIRLADTGIFANTVQTSVNSTVIGSNTAGKTQRITGAINGAGKFIQNGGGTSVFENVNTYQGGTRITNASTIVLGTISAGATAGQNIASPGTTIQVDTGSTLRLVNVSGGVLNNNIDNATAATAGTVDSNSTLVLKLTGVLSNTGAGATLAFTQNGIGTTILTGASSYTGATTVNAGTLQIGDGATGGTTIAPSGTVLVNATGTLAINLTNGSTFANGVNLVAANSALNGIAGAGSTNTLSGVITGIGVVNQNGGGTTKLSGANTYTGATTVNAGTLQAGIATAPGGLGVAPVSGAFGLLSAVNLSAAGAKLDLNGFSNEIGSLTGVVGTFVDNTAAGVATLTTGRAGSTTFNGIVQNAGGALSLVKEGAATTFTLTGLNTFTGTTTVNAGTLVAGHASALGNVGAGTTVTNGASLLVAAGINVVAEPLTINGAGAVSGGGTLGALGTTGGTSSYAGAITAATNATISANGGTLTLTGGINKNGVDLTFGGLTATNAGGKIIVNTVGISGAAANSDIIVDSVTMDLDAANTYNGKTFIRSTAAANTGILNTGVAGAMPSGATARSTVIMDQTAAFAASGLGGSTLNIGGTTANPAGANQSIASLDGLASSKVTLGANTLTIGFGTGVDVNGNAAANFIGTISGAGGITKDETSKQIFSGPNSYAGTTNVNAGILNIQNNTGLGTVAGGTVVATGATLQLQGTITVGAEALTLNGTGAAMQNGALVNVAGTNNYGGLITLGSASTISSDVGVLNITNAGTIVGGGFGLTLTGAANGSVTTKISPTTSSLTKNGAGTWTLNGTNTYSGATTVNNGTLQAGTTTSAFGVGSAVNLTNATGVAILDLNGNSNTIGSLTGVAASFVDNTAAGVATLTTGSAGSTTYNGVIRNTGGALSLTKTGALTTFTLATSANTYTGLTTVSQGILNIRNGASLGAATGTAATGTVVSNGATLQIQGGITVGNEALTLNGTGAALPLPAQTGALVNISGTNNFGGLITLGSASTISSDAGLLNLTNAGTIVGGGNALTLAGAANGSVTSIISPTVSSLTKNGAGTWTLNGANTYTGPTNVNGGTLKAGVASVANVSGAFGKNSAVILANTAGTTLDITGFNTQIGSLAGGGAAGGNVTLGAATLTTGDDNTSTTHSGVISGAGGALVKNGTGTFTVAGANTYTGGTTLNAGTLAAANGSAFGNGNLTVNAGTLRTSGGPLVINIGSGNVAINGGTVVANVGGTIPGVNHDQILTTGNVGAIAGTLALVQQGGYLLAPGDKVNLVQAGTVAGGSVNGTAIPNSGVTGLAAFSVTPLLIPTVNLYPTSVTLEAMQGSFLALTPVLGLTPNQIAVAGALDSVAAKNLFKTGIVPELNFLDTQPLSTLPGNLDKIAPEELTSIFHLGVALANVNSSNLTRRMDDIRSGNASAPSAPIGNGKRFVGGANGPTGKRSQEIAPPNDAKWGAFLTGSGEFTRIGSTSNAAGYNLNTGGVTVGADYRVNEKLAVGLSLGYANTSASLVNGGSLDADGGRFGIYATYFDQNFHLDASVTGGINSYRSRRVTPNNTVATGSPDGSEINVLIGAGYDFKFGALTVGPIASYQYTNMHMDGFTETGAFAPLTVSGKSADSSRTSLGIRASFEGHIGSVVIRPEVRLAWQHEFGGTSYAITSRFATLGGNPFTVSGTAVGRDSLLASAGFIIMWNERLGTYVYYDGNIGAKNLESHNISGGVRFQF